MKLRSYLDAPQPDPAGAVLRPWRSFSIWFLTLFAAGAPQVLPGAAGTGDPRGRHGAAQGGGGGSLALSLFGLTNLVSGRSPAAKWICTKNPA